MIALLLSLTLATAAPQKPTPPPQTANTYGNRAAIGVMIGEVYGGLAIGLGGWWVASMLDADIDRGVAGSNAVMFTVPVGVAAGGVIGGSVAAKETWAPVGLTTAVPIGAGLAVTSAGFSVNDVDRIGFRNRLIVSGISVMVIGPPIAARFSAVKAFEKRGLSTEISLVPTGNGLGLIGRF